MAGMAIAAIAAFGQGAGAEWFPVHPGDRWTYEYTTRDDDGRGRAHLDIHTWRTEETTTASWTVPEGLLVAREVRVIDGAPRAGWRVDPHPAYLVRGNCLYAGRGVGWDAAERRLTAEYRRALPAGEEAPDFCFPLAVRETWPEEAKDWEVVGARGRTFHVRNISGYPGSGMDVNIWYEQGVGMVREDEIHNGTIGEVHVRLLRFERCGR